MTPRDERGGHGEREVARRTGLRQHGDLGHDEQRQQRGWADRQKPAAAEQRIDGERQEAGIQSDLRRQTGQQRVGHGLGDEQGRHDHAREGIAPQVLALVVREPVQGRHQRVSHGAVVAHPQEMPV
jgi:hypothetical protein